MCWPRREGGSAAAPLKGTVMLGELVCDKEGGGVAAWRLLATDVLAIDGKATATQPLQKRLALLESEVLNPRRAPGVDTTAEILRVRKKDCYRLKYIPYLIKQFIPKLTHPADGLTFLRAEEPHPCVRPTRLGTQSAPAVIEWSSDGGGEGSGVPQSDLLAWAEKYFAS